MMTTTSLSNRYNALATKAQQLKVERSVLSSSIEKTLRKLDEVGNEELLIRESLEKIKDVKPLISAHSIDQCERLASQALSVIFDTDAYVKYNSDEGQFMIINSDNTEVSLRDGVGGGMVAVVSYVFNLFLLMKTHKRLILFFDEAFTQISKEYFTSFVSFIRALSKDLKVDLLWVSHDERLSDDMVDHIYRIEDGVSKKVK